MWVFGGIHDNSGYVVLKVVPNRIRDTLPRFITSVCPQGATVITDGWRALD